MPKIIRHLRQRQLEKADIIPAQSWEVFSFALHTLGKPALKLIFGKSESMIYSWGTPPTNESHQINPIDRICWMMEALADANRHEIGRAAIDIMAAPLGGHFEYLPGAETDKGTVDGELADSLVALGELADTCRHAVADGRLDSLEREEILEDLREVYLQLAQLLSAIEKETSGEKG
ncbi:MAG: hypothetical protein JRH08_00850 [Deltaproteobacteria bacterium]|nr:hypothetical protein [Deltaproteobacteria bacterium]MBW2025711.1 hypothetical protein [Deltaproteobacteria bacterium]MBW2124252.1 hypothetical protein [Deltaproteobacteria bacterium]